MERLPRNGDVLYNCLQRLISKSIGKSNVNGAVDDTDGHN